MVYHRKMATATTPRLTDRELDALFAALANTTRRSIVQRLAGGEATISELAKPFDMTLPAVSKHLLVLERAGLIRRQRDGQSRRCTLQPEALDCAETWISTTRQFWDETLDSLADYIEKMAVEPGTGS